MPIKRLVLGILAHVDAGKTTLSEAMLYKTGALRSLGRVDHGNAFLDTAPLEKQRGITIFSKEALLQTGGASFTLLDTPGHVDFSAEMERTLCALDCAVLVISGTDGIQSHTETLWKLLEHYRIPTFLFINKMDLQGAEKEMRLAEIKNRFSGSCVDFTTIEAEQEKLKWEEELSLCEENLMEFALAEKPLPIDAIAQAVSNRQVFPCYFGAALHAQGVQELLSGLEQYTVAPKDGESFGAKVFKVTQDAQGARLTWIKITSGILRAKTMLESRADAPKQWKEKIDQIRIYSGEKYAQAETAYTGMAVAVTGLSACNIGEGLGIEQHTKAPLLEPVLNYKIYSPPKTDLHAVHKALEQLCAEDPQLHLHYDTKLEELQIQLMGQVQAQILQSVLLERFGLEVSFGEGSILYKETILEPIEGIGHYEPLRHYAEVHLVLEPLEQGAGLDFVAKCSLDVLGKNWQNLVLSHLAEKEHIGVLIGAPITDMRITLIAGRAHLKHTEGGDFRQATYRAVRHGLRCTKSQLLEPWLDFKIEVPAEQIGRTMADIQRYNGTFEPSIVGEDTAVLTGTAPVATMQSYATELTSYTKGKGRINQRIKGYLPCHNSEEVIAKMAYDADVDLENPCGSVFCSHGAGYVVSWQDVKAHAHIDTGYGKAVEEESVYIPRNSRSAYTGTLAQDKELLAIFEKTYGPIKKDVHKVFAPSAKKTQNSNNSKSEPMPTGPEYLLIDGYNVLHAWDDLQKMANDNLANARQHLADMLCNYQGYRGGKVILVFDAYQVKGSIGVVENYHNIQIVYTKEAETADTYIEKATHTMAKKHKVRVVTSDATIQYIILGSGGLRVSARAFRQEVDQVEKEIRDYLLR